MSSRRHFLGATGLAAGGLAAANLLPRHANAEMFFGPHQPGITTTPQSHIYLAIFDVNTSKRADLIALLRDWTDVSARMSAGLPAAPIDDDLTRPAADSGEAIGMDPARLTLTFGFGAELFSLDGADRFGIARARPAALIDLPHFPGDQFEPGKSGGALMVQACADDPTIAFHAVRQLARRGDGIVSIKWVSAGFSSGRRVKGTPRNLLGFKDGTMNPDVADQRVMQQSVWVGPEGPGWMQGGTYAVVRRIRVALDHWDQMKLGFQEQTIGRHKYSGAPLGDTHEFAPLDLAATNAQGDLVIPQTAHARLGAPAANGGAQMLRRGYSYSYGAGFAAERWPPWKQAVEFDAGLLFVAFQKDPRTGFVRVFTPMSRIDALNQFTTHTGSGLFACPGGVQAGGYIGQGLFQAL
ncbi:MAG: deferrochelatase/peroxidase EfeB [Rhodospirillales bacterium 20-60-12]|nr:MAG: deferrochelatase/peroxidase EfeB [Rhodospirillales bacterium 20-60-12]HQT66285.1 Dyp-type peroxidase [Acetobacteraceae bacterium]